MKIKTPKISFSILRRTPPIAAMLVLVLMALISPLVNPEVALAATTGNYIFDTPSDGTSLAALKKAVDAQDENSDALANTAVYVKNGVFGDTPFKLSLNTDRSGCAQADGFSFGGCGNDAGGDDHFGGQAEDVYVYSGTYVCEGGKIVDEGSVGSDKANYVVDFNVSLKLGQTGQDHALFDSNGKINPSVKLHWMGFGSTQSAGVRFTPAETPGTARQPKDLAIKDLPSNCLPPNIPASVRSSSSNDTELSNNGIVNLDIAILSQASDAVQKDWGDVASTASNGSSATGGAGGSGAPGLKCKVQFLNPLTWLLCPAVKGMVNIVGAVDDLITSQLSVGSNGNTSDPNQIFCDKDSSGGAAKSCQAYEDAWKSFRNIALGLLVVGGLIIVTAQALGWEILDAYAIRKTLPRLIIAAVAITLSWKLMQFFVELTNDLGYGIRTLIYRPFAQAGFSQATLGGGGTVATAFAGGVAIGALGIFGALSFAATAALAVAIAFLVLVIRQLVIVVLIIFAPVAIIAFILPNTQKVYKIWWESFSKALLMFPIIAAFIAAGRVFAAVSATNDASTLGQFIGFVSYFAPYFLLPLTFRFAGGALGNIGGFVNNKGKGGFDRLKKFRAGQYQSHGARKVENAGRRVLSKRADVNERLQNLASRESMNPLARKAIGRFASTTAGYNLEALQSAKRQNVAKELNDQIATGRDEEIRGLLINKKLAQEAGPLQTRADGSRDNGQMRVGTDGKRQFKSLGGAWIDEAKVDAGQRRWGNDNFAKQAALSYEIKKTDSVDDVQNLKDNYGEVALRSGMSREQAQGAWQGATFENQNQHLELKHTDWESGQMTATGAKKFASEAYEKKGSYAMSQMHASTIKQLGEAFDIGDTDDKRNIAGVAETAVSRFGAGGAGVAGMAGDVPIAAPGVPGGPSVQVNAQGAGHVNESFRDLARKTGVLRARTGDPTSDTTNEPFQYNDPQN